MKGRPHQDPECACPACAQWEEAHIEDLKKIMAKGTLSIDLILEMLNLDPSVGRPV